MWWRRAPGAVVGALRKPLVSMSVGLLVGAGLATGIAAGLWPQGAQPSLGSVAVHQPGVRTGPFLVQARELRCGLEEIVGTHAEFYPKEGQFCRVRVDVTAEEAAEDTWDSLLQHLGTGTGDTTATSLDAMHVKRQPLQFSIGGYATVEFDLWFDVPRGANAATLLVRDTASDPPVGIPLPKHSWPYGAAG